ncbi:MAG: hypothetical protein EXQ56_03360 [Acidobacteria bacterium]|nr:hypothetical protein [Acidobacteriota bacterium]
MRSRGGHGVSFGAIHPLLYQRARFNPPDLLLVQVQFPSLLDPLANAEESSVGGKRSEIKTMDPDLVSPYSHVYSLQIQQELPANFSLTLGYVGERTFKLPVRLVGNRGVEVPGMVAATGNIDARRPHPNYLQMTSALNGVTAYFGALQATLARKLSYGLALNVRYRFSKSISTGDTTFAEIETGTGVAQTANERNSDLKGVTKFDSPHSLTAGFNYEFPDLRLAGEAHDSSPSCWGAGA